MASSTAKPNAINRSTKGFDSGKIDERAINAIFYDSRKVQENSLLIANVPFFLKENLTSL